MAVTASGLFFPTWRDLLDTTQLAIDLDLETHKGAMFTDTVTPNFGTDTAYGASPYDANEVAGANYTAGGKVITTSVISDESGTLTWDGDNLTWASSTITDAMCCLIYADALADQAIVLVDFVSAASTVNGTFTITWAAPASGGIFNIDLTP